MAIQTGNTADAADFRGMIFPYAGSTAPTGFLLCDGAAVSRTTFAGLFALIGTTYGAGDGSTTFNVPNLRGKVIVGASATTADKVFTFSSRSGNTLTVTSDVLTNSSTNEVQTGQAVLYDTTATAIGGLTDNTTYYLIRIAHNQFQLAATVADANSGIAITLTSNGSGTQTFTITGSVRSIGQQGGNEVQANVPEHRHSISNIGDVIASSGTGANRLLPTGTLNTNNTGSTSPSNMPPFLVLNYIIKT